jgi:hypothetical protein
MKTNGCPSDLSCMKAQPSSPSQTCLDLRKNNTGVRSLVARALSGRLLYLQQASDVRKSI